MAVTLTVADIRERVGAAEPGDYDIAPLWFEVARAAVVRYAPIAPDESHNLAVLMMLDYWSELPSPPHVASQMDGGGKQVQWNTSRSGNSLRYSGAMALLSPHKRRRAL